MEILANVEGRRTGSWVRQAAAIAEGMRGSGVLDRVDLIGDRIDMVGDRIDVGFAGMGTNLAGLAAVVGVSAQLVASEIAMSNRFLGIVIDTLRNPRATGANERFRAGLNALQKGWTREAIEELQESITLLRFHAPTHAALGHALASEGRFSEAVESYSLAARYASPDFPELAAGCILLAAGLLEQDGKSLEAAELLNDATQKLPDFAEIGLAHARVSREPSKLRQALTTAPELVVIALAADIHGVEDVATHLARAGDGPVVLAVRLRNALAEIQSAFPEVGMPLGEFGDLGAQSPPDDLMAASKLFLATESILPRLRSPLTIYRGAIPKTAAEVDWKSDLEKLDILKVNQKVLGSRIASIEHSLSLIGGEAALATSFRLNRKVEQARLIPGQLSEIEEELRGVGVTIRPFRWDGPVDLPTKLRYSDYRRLVARLDRLRLDIEELEAGLESYHSELAKSRESFRASLEPLRKQLGEELAQMNDIEERVAALRIQVDAERAAKAAADAVALAEWDRLGNEVVRIAALRPTRRIPWDGNMRT